MNCLFKLYRFCNHSQRCQHFCFMSDFTFTYTLIFLLSKLLKLFKMVFFWLPCKPPMYIFFKTNLDKSKI